MAIAVTSFPTALDTSASLVAAVNNTSTNLSSAITNAVTTIPVDSATAFPSSGVVLIDTEYISYTGKTANTLTGCTRGFESSSATAHSSGAAVKFVLTAQMWQAIINAIIALETKLGTGSGVAASAQALMGTGAGASGWRALLSSDIPSLDAAKITTGQFPIARLASGTPTGSKFIRDDGTLQPIPGGGDALTTSPLSQFAATTSAQLAGVLTDETGTGGGFVRATGPTLNNPIINSPTGIVKGDVGLGNVDNTSDATKNSAVATLTNKTISGSNNTISGITESMQSLSDVTTGNASTTAHGYLKKLSNVATEFMNGVGNWVVPAGSGDMSLASVQTVTGAKTFNDGMLILQHSTTTLPSVIAGAFIQLSNGKTYVGKPDGSAWVEILLAGVSGPVSVPSGGTGATTLTGVLKGNGTSAFTIAKEVMSWALSDESTTITTGVKVTDRAPFAFYVTDVRISLTTASTSGLVTLNVKCNGTSIFTTQVSIDANEKTSVTAATPAVISGSPYLIADDDELTFDVTAAGTGAKGLKVRLIGRQS